MWELTKMRCPDCDSISSSVAFFKETPGDGVCSKCHGNGIGGLLDQFADSFNPFGTGHIKCDNCDGSGVCPTCDGTGEVDE